MRTARDSGDPVIRERCHKLVSKIIIYVITVFHGFGELWKARAVDWLEVSQFSHRSGMASRAATKCRNRIVLR